MKKRERYCANCEWSISPELADEINREQGYLEDDPRRVEGGQCCLGRTPNEEFFCSSHVFIDEE